MSRKLWKLAQSDKEAAATLAESCEIDPFLSLLLYSRGFSDDEQIYDFLHPDAMLSDPFELIDMEAAAERVEQAIEGFEKIAVFGDYDADGVTAAALLYLYLRERGANVVCILPDRIRDGYGLSPEAVERLFDSGVRLIVTVDNGIAALDAAARAKELGIDLVVTDHHRPGDKTIERPILNHTDSSASSTCEIIAEMIHYTSSPDPIALSPLFATFMLSGMFLDTNFFKSSATGARTFEAAEILKGFGADNVKADSFLKDDLTEYQTISQAFSEAESVYPGVLVACLNDDDDPLEDATISKIAVQCMMAKGVHASFAIARISSKAVKISARSDGTINVQLLAEKLGGGGHFEASAAVFLNTAPSIVKSKVIDVLKNYLDLATSDNANKGGAA